MRLLYVSKYVVEHSFKNSKTNELTESLKTKIEMAFYKPRIS